MIITETEKVQEILCKAQNFLTTSALQNSNQMKSQRNSLLAFSGHFWTDEVKRKYKRGKKTSLHNSCWPTLANNVVSKFTESPWHAQLKEVGDIQDKVNTFEGMLSSKNAQSVAFLRSVACGCGYLHILSSEKPEIECIKNHTSVFVDAYAKSVDLSDANECLIVNFISAERAKDEYDWNGDKISLNNVDIWNKGRTTAAYVTYYMKHESGFVVRYDICGEWIEETILPCTIIPVIRFAGYESYGTDGVTYDGIVQKTWDLQLQENIAYSSMLDRMNKQVRSLVAMSVQSMGSNDVSGDIIRESLAKVNNNESFVLAYDANGGQPQLLTEHFATDDLTSVIASIRQQMVDVTGIPLQGMNYTEKTATEVLIQQNNISASVTELFLHAEMASRSIARIIIQLCNQGEDLEFELENGPSCVSSDMKKRQELGLIAQFSSEESKPYIAYKIAQTCRMGNEICNSLRANLGDFKIVEEEMNVGTIAAEALNDKNTAMEAVQIAENMQEELQEAKLRADSAEQMLSSQKEQFALEKQKLEISMQQKELEFKLKLAEMTAKCAKMEAETAKIEADTKAKETENAVTDYNIAAEVANNMMEGI